MNFFKRPTLPEQRADLAAKLAEAERAALVARDAIVGGGDPAIAAAAKIKAEALAAALADLDGKIATEEQRLLHEKRQAERQEAAGNLLKVAADLETAHAAYLRWLADTFVPLLRAIDVVKGTSYSQQLHDGPHLAAAGLFDREMNDLRTKARVIAGGSGDAFLRAALGRRPS